MKKSLNLVVFSGAGMSAESGLKTFRGNGGLWEGNRVEDVATPGAWKSNPEVVTRFYDERRAQMFEVEPNDGHRLVAALEHYFNVQVITQNVDDLHERAGSSSVLHLHGELRKVRSERTGKVYTLERSHLPYPSYCPEGGLLRPHIVWFGEEVPAMEPAVQLVQQAEILLVIGTSLQVYPAASLIHYVQEGCMKYLIDPDPAYARDFQIIRSGAAEGMRRLFQLLEL